MSITVGNRSISSIGLIDDDDDVRRGYRYSTDDLDLAARDVEGPIRDLEASVRTFRDSFDAVICDYNLKTKNYSSVNGDEVCVGLYKSNIPAVLCTRFDGSLPSPIRKNRRYIPTVVAPSELDAEILRAALSVCAEELVGKFTKERKPYRAVLRIEGGECYEGAGILVLNLVVPSWNPSHLFTMEIDASAGAAYDLALESVASGEVARMFADVNLDAETVDDLFVSEWRLS